MQIQLPDWLNNLLGIYGPDLLRSLVLMLVLMALHASIVRGIAANEQVPVDVRRRWTINARNTLLIIGVGGLLVIWARELQTIALSMVAFAAALVLATKEVLMCLAGGMVRSVSNSYSPGDIVEIGDMRGRVMDITMLTTTILEIGPRHDGHQITGRSLIFPNSLLLSHAIARETFNGDYTMHIMTVPMSYDIRPERAERLLQGIADTACEPFLNEARAHMAMLESKLMMDTPSVEPRVSLQVQNEKEYKLILRIALPPRERQRIEQHILRQFLFACYPESADSPTLAAK